MLSVSKLISRPTNLCLSTRKYATILMDGRGTFERNFNWKMKFCIGDFPGFSSPTEAVNFNFPNVVFAYNKQDAVNHAISSKYRIQDSLQNKIFNEVSLAKPKQGSSLFLAKPKPSIQHD